jgi:hypothetical protein
VPPDPASPASLAVEPTGEAEFGPCDCCGSQSRRVWGFVHRGETTVCAYFVFWTPGRIDHGAAVDLVIGSWGDGADPEHRFAVALDWRVTGTGPAFMVVDAAGRSAADPSVAGRALDRDEVIGTDLAAETFAVVDAIWVGDGRAAELSKA